jgi:hypothetical protein
MTETDNDRSSTMGLNFTSSNYALEAYMSKFKLQGSQIEVD